MSKYQLFPSGKKLCTLHNEVFFGFECPKCSIGSICPSNSSQKSGNAKREVSSEFTSNSQAITSNSQGVHILKGQGFHAKRRYQKRVKNSIFERFHNYGVKFDAIVDWDALFVDPTRLNNNVSYKRLDFELGIVKVFRRSILVTLRSSQEIIGLDVKSAEKVAQLKINTLLELLPKAIKVSVKNVVSTHNAFVNHPTAKYNVRVDVDGECRLLSDNSKGNPEFEAVNTVFAVSDSQVLESFNRDLIVNKPELPSVQAQKLSHIVNILDKYATQMDLHLEVEQKTSDTLSLIQQTLSNKPKPQEFFCDLDGCTPAPSCSPTSNDSASFSARGGRDFSHVVASDFSLKVLKLRLWGVYDV